LNILVLANKAAGIMPAQRYRFEQWAPYLKRDHGIVLHLLPFESERLSQILYKRGHIGSKALWIAHDFLRRAKVFTRLRDVDAVLIFREASLLGPAIYERLLALTGKPIIFDFDDAIWMHQPGSSVASRLRFVGKTRSICRLATAVSCGNSYLASFANRYNKNVFIVPSTIDFKDYPAIQEPNSDRFIVCWTGSHSTLRHLIYAREGLEKLAAKIPLTVKIICSEPPSWQVVGAENLFVRWSSENEAHEVGTCHASIMPLPDDEFARGKCGLKALQAMATGRPVVVSPVGVNTEIVRDGFNGFVATTTEDLLEALLRLANSRQLRAVLGANARNTVRAEYSAEIGSTKFAEVVNFVVQPETSRSVSSYSNGHSL
jgi:glycosyltransferase involved in cell wall biosynthesis